MPPFFSPLFFDGAAQIIVSNVECVKADDIVIEAACCWVIIGCLRKGNGKMKVTRFRAVGLCMYFRSLNGDTIACINKAATNDQDFSAFSSHSLSFSLSSLLFFFLCPSRLAESHQTQSFQKRPLFYSASVHMQLCRATRRRKSDRTISPLQSSRCTFCHMKSTLT
jgi:hypothetical protein